MKELKFKVGDKVKVIENRSGSVNPVGSVGIIISLNHYNYTVKVDGVKGAGDAHVEGDLESVKELTNIELQLYNLLEIDLEISYFYNIGITEYGIRLQGHIGSDVVRDLIKLGYKPETETSSHLRFHKDSIVVVLT